MVCQLRDNQDGKWKVEEERNMVDGSFLVCAAMLYIPNVEQLQATMGKAALSALIPESTFRLPGGARSECTRPTIRIR